MAKIHKPKQHGHKSKKKRQNIRRTLRLKRITGAQLLSDLSQFAKEFEDVYEDEVLPTPQADRGIGPVQYDIKFHAGRAINRTFLTVLDNLVRTEKFMGDTLIKLDLSMVAQLYGTEEPLKWIPAAFRVGIRIQTNNMVTREIDNHRLARQRDTPWRVRNSFIHYLAGASKAANKLELEYMYNGYPDVGILPPGYDLFHILESRVLQHRKRLHYVAQAQSVMKKLLRYSPWMGSPKAMKRLAHFKDADRNNQTASASKNNS